MQVTQRIHGAGTSWVCSVLVAHSLTMGPGRPVRPIGPAGPLSASCNRERNVAQLVSLLHCCNGPKPSRHQPHGLSTHREPRILGAMPIASVNLPKNIQPAAPPTLFCIYKWANPLDGAWVCGEDRWTYTPPAHRHLPHLHPLCTVHTES